MSSFIRNFRLSLRVSALAALVLAIPVAARTQPPPTAPGSGTVIISRQSPTDSDSTPAAEPPRLNAAPQPRIIPIAPDGNDPLAVTDIERDTLTFTAYDLDLHLTPAASGLAVRAVLTVRNDSPAPLPRLVLQISSSLHWERFSIPGAAAALPFVIRPLATDADHTGYAEEAVVTLPHPLGPGSTLSLTALYSGTIPHSAERLERIGVSPAQASFADWDAIDPTSTALRGFGNVLWVPGAAPPVFLGDGAKLPQAEGHARLRQSAATVRLRLAVEFPGEPPDAVFFCGRRLPLTAIHDDPNLPIAESPGIATALFQTQPLGFRPLSLFITSHPPDQINPATASPQDVGLIAAITDHPDAVSTYAAAAALVQPLLADWFGPQPFTPLFLIDHPGQPFEDGALLVRSMQPETAASLAPTLAHSLTHTWIHSSRPWIDEGLAEFAGLLYTEHSLGRPAALDALQQAAKPLALIEPPSGSPPGATGQSLPEASSEIYFRTKAAAVWWMLRTLAGDHALQQALQAYRLDPALDRDPAGFEHTLARFTSADLHWFFDDWVYHDRGLPDLSIVNVTPRQLEAHNNLRGGWLIAVEVHNDGDAAADVPVTVRGLAAQNATAAVETQRLRIPGHATVSIRIVFPSTPAEVQVNDGGTPETGPAIHTRQIILPSLR